jgi:hypothetical protein
MSDTIEVLDMVDQPDGSAIMTMDVEPELVRAFAHTGLKYLIEQVEVQDDTISPNTFEESTRAIELTNEELNTLFHFGVISALKRGMEGDLCQQP